MWAQRTLGASGGRHDAEARAEHICACQHDIAHEVGAHDELAELPDEARAGRGVDGVCAAHADGDAAVARGERDVVRALARRLDLREVAGAEEHVRVLVVREDDAGLFGERLQELNVALPCLEAQQPAEIRWDKKGYRGYIGAVSIASSVVLGS